MSTNEIEEFQARISVLVRELNDKNMQIENVQAEKQSLLQTKSKMGKLDIEIEDHRDEIDSLNLRYQTALKQKADAYIELVDSIKELKKRHNRFFNNELGLVQLQNQCKTLKKELEQKEKQCEDIRSMEVFTVNKGLVKQIEDTVESINSRVKSTRAQIKQKQDEITFLEEVKIIKQKQADMQKRKDQGEEEDKK